MPPEVKISTRGELGRHASEAVVGSAFIEARKIGGRNGRGSNITAFLLSFGEGGRRRPCVGGHVCRQAARGHASRHKAVLSKISKRVRRRVLGNSREKILNREAKNGLFFQGGTVRAIWRQCNNVTI